MNQLSGDRGLFEYTFPKLVIEFEKIYEIELRIDHYIMTQVWQRVEKTLLLYGMEDPNEAKKASSVAFWIRKLKPVSYTREIDMKRYNPYINELLGLIFSILIYYTHKQTRQANMSKLLNGLLRGKNDGDMDRVFGDLIHSYRYHSHSPHSAYLLFEVMFGNTVLQFKKEK